MAFAIREWRSPVLHAAPVIIMVGDMLGVTMMMVSSNTNMIVMMIISMVAIGVMMVREIASLSRHGFNIC